MLGGGDSSLRRRRGTKSSRRQRKQMQRLIMICVGMGMIIFVVGLGVLWLMSSSPPENSNAAKGKEFFLKQKSKVEHLLHRDDAAKNNENNNDNDILENNLGADQDMPPPEVKKRPVDEKFKNMKPEMLQRMVRERQREKERNGDLMDEDHHRQHLRPVAEPIADEVISIGKQTFLNYVPKTPSGDFPYLGPIVEPDHDFTTFTAPGGSRFQEYTNGDLPYIITDDMYQQSDNVARSRRVHVKNAMKHAWSSYTKYAFGMDEILPQSKTGTNGWGGIGITLVDSLDTLWLMGMKEEFDQAAQWVDTGLHHENCHHHVSVFETTIRSLGGLLSAYDWSGNEVFLRQAKDLGARLFNAFKSPSGIPYGQVALDSGNGQNIGWTGGNAILAEFGTIQIEFRMLARLSGNQMYKEKSEHIFTVLHDMHPAHGLYPYFIRNRGMTPEFANNKLTFGAMADSFYEYMLKVWIQGGKTEDLYRTMYDESIQGMHDELLQVSTPSGLVFIADKNGGRLDTKMDHLVCFMGGLLGLGAYTDPLGLESERAQRDLKTAKALTYTCYQMYARMNTGISAEFVQFYAGNDFDIGRGAPHYLLRPETVESFFVLYQLTKDPIYREWGWEVFQAIERYCKTEYAYGSLKNVNDVKRPPENKMESFFLAETLKYLYLLFDPDTEVDVLHKHVFNTEAHPMRIFPVMDVDGAPDLLK